MPSIPVPFPDSTFPGTHFQESGGRIINSYVEPLGAGAPSQIIYRRAPGLLNFGITSRAGFRGGIEVNGVLYCAFDSRLVRFSSAGAAAIDVGALTGTAKGFFARNTRSGNPTPPPDPEPFPGLVFCDPDGNYASIDTATNTVTMSYMVGTFPSFPAPNSVCVLDNYFFYTNGNGVVWASGLNSIIVGASSFATAESKPDGLVRGVAWSGQLFLFGPATTEVWVNAGTTPFPFQRSVVIPRGLAGPFCVSAFEENFSRSLIWVADDNTVVRLNGYNPEKISPPDLDGLIEREPGSGGNKRTLEMSCFVSRGHAFILLSSPTWSWVFDTNTNKWSERNSHLQPRSRITGGVFAYNKWLCGDLLSTNVQEVTNTTHRETPGSQLVTGAVAAPRHITAATVQAAGSGYVVGDNITLSNGVVLQVVTLSGSGVATVSIINAGSVSGAPPGNPIAQLGTTGVGLGATFNLTWGVSSGLIRLTVTDARRFFSDDVVVSGVSGTTEANGSWSITVINDTTIELIGSTFANAFALPPGVVTDTVSPPFRWRLESGAVENFPVGSRVGRFDCEFVTGVGMATGIDPIQTNPTVEISWSDDGGQTYYAPIQRKLGQQAQTRQLVSLIACTGRSSWNARRWRLDIADPVYVGFMGAYQSASSKVSDIG